MNGWDDQDTPPRNATVLIEKTGAGGGYCSGSLLTSTHVLTAVHCDIKPGDLIWFGADNKKFLGSSPRAMRTVVPGGVLENLPGVGI